jgi:hypothetical protein
MNEVKKVILFLLCCAIPFSFYAQKARQNAVTKKWGYEQTENKGWWENSKYRGNSMFGGWDAALVNQDYEINWLISPQYEGVTKRFTEKLAGVVLGGKVGFIDIHNRFIIKPQFENADDIHGFNLGLSAVKKNGKFGFINKKGFCHILCKAIRELSLRIYPTEYGIQPNRCFAIHKTTYIINPSR